MRIKAKIRSLGTRDTKPLNCSRGSARIFPHPYLIGIVIGSTGLILFNWLRHDWAAIKATLVVTTLFFLVHFYEYWRSPIQDVQLNEWINIVPDGIRVEKSAGGTIFTPWREYDEFIQSEKFITITSKAKDTEVIVKISELSEDDKLSLISQLTEVLTRAT